MKLRTTIATALAAALGAGLTAASAGTPGYYVSGEGTASFLPDLTFKNPTLGNDKTQFDTGYGFGGAFGYDMGDGWRYEVDSLYQNSPLTRFGAAPANGHLSSTSVIANVTMDILPNATLTPYVGAGLGVQNVGGTINGLSGREWEPAYQAEAGLRSDLSEKVSLFGEYRFSQSEAVTLSDATDTAHQHFADHGLLAGISYHLN